MANDSQTTFVLSSTDVRLEKEAEEVAEAQEPWGSPGDITFSPGLVRRDRHLDTQSLNVVHSRDLTTDSNTDKPPGPPPVVRLLSPDELPVLGPVFLLVNLSQPTNIGLGRLPGKLAAVAYAVGKEAR